MANFLAIFWYFGDTEILRYDNKGKEIIHSRVTVDEKGFLQGNASITLSNVTISDEGTYRCLVIHSPSRQEKKISFRVQAVPGVRIVKKTLIKKEEGALQCLVTDYYPQSITVTWLLNGKPLTRSAPGTPRQNEDGTFRVNSSVTLLPSETQDNLVIGCQVQHESHPTPLTDSFKMVFGVPPSVRMFSSKVEGHSEKIFVCEASGFSPEPVQIKWLMDGVRVEEPRTSDGGGSIKESYYRVTSGPETQLANITCEAYHETLYQPVTETLQITKNYRHYYGTIVAVLLFPGLLLFWFIFITLKNFLRVRVSPIHKLMSDDGEKLTLYCVASNWPKDPQVTWAVINNSDTKSKEKRKVIWKETDNSKGKGSVPESLTTSGESDTLLTEEYSMRTDRLEAGGLHNVLATLSFKPDAQKHENIEVSCRFVCGGKIKERKLQYSYILRQPQVSQPIKLSINETGDLLYSLVLQEFYPRQIQIRWSCGVGCYQDMESNTKIIPCSSIQAFNAESECKIPGQLLKDPGFTVRVTWKHESMTGPEQQELSVRDKEFPWRPQMEEIINPDTLIHSKEGKFQCKIWGYFPDALEVKWLRREAGGQELFSVCPSEKYKIPEMEQKREADGTFSCTVSLIVSVSLTTEQGAEFICRVGHPSLGEPLERSTGILSVRRAPVINITHEGDKIRAEIDQFYPQNIGVIWSRTKNIKDVTFKECEASRISNETHSNSDGTYRIISSCDTKKPSDKKHIKLHVTHEALGNPIEKIFIREKGKYYEQQGDKNILLQKHPE
ncbi:hypothetical protein XELAEV_18001295mg [Xenopus laevis]|nr:hypothetical protein XELAEV_18001295mg [Xenopus laevis]